MLKNFLMIQFIVIVVLLITKSTLLRGNVIESRKQLNTFLIRSINKNTIKNSNRNLNLNDKAIYAMHFNLKSEKDKDISGTDSILSNWKKYGALIKKYIYKDYKKMYREKGGNFEYPFLTPGSSYSDQLWDWDSWLSDVALRQILLEHGSEKEKEQAIKYEQGCVLNFLHYCDVDGWVPIVIQRDSIYSELMSGFLKPKDIYKENMHKPCLAQQAAFIVQMNNGNAEWLRDEFAKLQFFINNYRSHDRNRATGLYFWQTDHYIGGDNDPCTFYRPPRSSGSIFLNSLMYKELKAMAYLAKQLNFN